MGSGYLVASSLRWALVLLAATAVLCAAVEIATFGQAAGVGSLWLADLYPAAGLVYVATGVVAWWRRPSNRLGAIMVFTGLSILIGSLGSFGEPVLSAVGVVLATLPLAAVVQLTLAFPSGRLRSSAARWTVAAGYVTCLVFQIPLTFSVTLLDDERA